MLIVPDRVIHSEMQSSLGSLRIINYPKWLPVLLIALQYINLVQADMSSLR
jgi:hypothetical protein